MVLVSVTLASAAAGDGSGRPDQSKSLSFLCERTNVVFSYCVLPPPVRQTLFSRLCPTTVHLCREMKQRAQRWIVTASALWWQGDLPEAQTNRMMIMYVQHQLLLSTWRRRVSTRRSVAIIMGCCRRLPARIRMMQIPSRAVRAVGDCRSCMCTDRT